MSSKEESELDSDVEEEEDSELDSDLEEEEESDQSSDYDFLPFLVVREQDSGCYDVIPSTWVLTAYDYDNGDQTTIDYLFPSEDELGELVVTDENEPTGDGWPQFFGDMLYESYSVESALQFIDEQTKRDEEISKLMAYKRRKERGSEKKKDAPKLSGTKRKQPANENNPKKSKTSTEPAPAASTSSTVASKPPVATDPKKKTASKAHR